MKNLKFLIPILVLTSGLFFACNNSDDDDGLSLNGNCGASWKVDGTAYSKDDLAFCIYLDSTLNLSSSVAALDFNLQIDPITAPGTFTFDPNNNTGPNVVILLPLGNGTTLGPASATITVTELSSSGARGTFSGQFFDVADINLSPDFTVTEGEFQASF